MAIQIGVLGGVRASENDHAIDLGPPKQRLVLAVLQCHHGQPLSTEQLIEHVWHVDAPASAAGNIRLHVHRLRKVLGHESIIGGERRGYTFALPTELVDSFQFARLTAEGRVALTAGSFAVASRKLREALALWRGEAYADLPDEEALRETIARLNQDRLAAQLWRVEADLALGLHTDLLGELTMLAARHPFHERLHAQLILTLYRCGRQAEALAAYRSIREALAEELGIDPGPELAALHRAVLHADVRLEQFGAELHRPGRPDRAPAPPAPSPAQLIADVADFTGREEDLRRLDEYAAETTACMTLVAITGTAGVGKTAIAVHWAHRHIDQFPDGQLYVNLRGYGLDEPVDAIAALTMLIRSLGVDGLAVPATVEEAAALYRSLLAGKRVLVVLDNAASVRQVRPILPATSSCVVLVTSRDSLTGLTARDGAKRIDLRRFTPTESHNLAVRLLGAERVEAEPHAVAELAAACCHLPLALRITMAHLIEKPWCSIAGHVAELTSGDRLSALDIAGDDHASVRQAIDASYARLPAECSRLFRLLGCVRGPDFSTDAVAALADVSRPAASALLGQLTAAHLVEEPNPGRYSLHDLLRESAAQRARSTDGAADLAAAVTRLHHFYLRHTDAAIRHLYPHMLRLQAASDDPSLFADATAGLAWLTAEQANLVAATVHAAELGSFELAWLLADALRPYFWHRKQASPEWFVVARAGLGAAVAAAEPRACAAAHLNLAMASLTGADLTEAAAHNEQALAYSRRAAWPAGEAAALSNLGVVCCQSGRPQEAVEHFSDALAANRRADRRAGQATNLSNLGTLRIELGQLDQAAQNLAEALAIERETGNEYSQAVMLCALGDVDRLQGRLVEARERLDLALRLSRAVGDVRVQIDAQRHLAELCSAVGDHTSAHEYAQTAVDAVGTARISTAINTLGTVRRADGCAAEAIECHSEALDLARAEGNAYALATSLIGLAAAYNSIADRDRAAGNARQALATAQRMGYRLVDCDARTILAEVEFESGARDSARQHLTVAHELATAAGYEAGRIRVATILADWRAR